jgi:pilus assembly protein Flp/PilA
MFALAVNWPVLFFPFLDCSILNMRNCSMSTAMNKIRRFLVSEDGPTAVEYAVMLALIVIVCLAAIGNIGTNAKTTFTNVAASIAS